MSKQDRGKEDQFARGIKVCLEGALGKPYTVYTKQRLLYTLQIDVNGHVWPPPDQHTSPKAGQLYAFQTDVLIRKVRPNIPLVVIETKFDRVSTHDIITYSAKAARHKEIYPYLRYGFVVGNLRSLSKKFFGAQSRY